ncbi:MAG TPA: aspartate aminotransferase family protein [Candidatus Latescibacteria bacterium]|nr:aspartate aminotransferase family protein [Candidatus Handelsmanbacteria bacterium]HIL09715.1 aspartate aminotransferase family protein [Candidatus Latescibacterota bacterium]
MKTEDIIKGEQQYILQTYGRPEFVLERGNGVYLFDTEGNRYLDFVSGLAVNAFGYGDYDVLKAIEEQSAKLMHVSNLYHTIPSVQLAKMLVENSFADRVFFCNSGTESWEATLKFCRKWGNTTHAKPKNRLLAFNDSFHGRTYGSISTTGQPKYHKGFEPLLPGIDFADFNDLASVEKALTDETCAILVEPLQAEGGIYSATPEFLQGLRDLCDEREMLLVFDEIQVGCGRLGSLWAHQQYGVEPDIMTLAKALGGGLPIGVALLRQKVADAIQAGDHAATFGANPVACAAAVVVFGKLIEDGFIDTVREKGEYLIGRLEKLQERWPEHISGVRGRGLIAGAVTQRPAADYLAAFRERDILVATAGADVVRFLPPLIVEKDRIDEVVDVFDEILRQGV